MPTLSAEDFLSKLATDINFRSQFNLSPNMSLGEFQSKAAACGFNYTFEEILTAAEIQQDAALSDDNLDNVTGGVANNPIYKLIISIKNISL